MRWSKRKIIWWTGSGFMVLVAGAIVIFLVAQQSAHQLQARPSVDNPAPQDEGGNSVLTVKTICPKCNPDFAFSVQEPATVTAYYFSELDAQVAGQLVRIRKAEGASVKAGELLAKLAVPDLDQEVALKDATVQQRREELQVARENAKIAEAAKVVAENNVEVEKAGEDAAKAMETYRGKLYRRLQKLVQGPVPGATGEVAEEAELAYFAALADVRKASSAVIRAKSASVEAQAKLDAANADVRLKQALIRVAEQDREKAKAAASYSEVRSLFDGKVKRRHADPSSFLRVGEPILTVERTDIVTVAMKVPDTFAPYVRVGLDPKDNTDAVIEMSELPGQAIHAKVTRMVPSLETKTNDHTMLVLVDLYNGTQKQYEDFIAREQAKKPPQEPFDDLKENSLPVAPKLMGAKPDESPHLLPGYYGQMRLIFNQLPNVFLIPSDAIDRSGGTPSVFLVKDGKVHRAEVEVDVDDQKLAKVRIIERKSTGQVRQALTGKEEIIYSNLNELTEGESVETIPIDWMPRD